MQVSLWFAAANWEVTLSWTAVPSSLAALVFEGVATEGTYFPFRGVVAAPDL